MFFCLGGIVDWRDKQRVAETHDHGVGFICKSMSSIVLQLVDKVEE